MNTQPTISIIIPVYNEESIITSCLDALKQLNYPKDMLEIIVIDNNSKDKSADIVRSYPKVQYIFEERKGRSAARNKGVKAAKGEMLAFIDADCMVSPDWLNDILKGFKSKSTGCCGGKTLSYYPENIIEHYFDWSFKSHASKMLNFSEKYFIGPIFATSNLMCRKEIFESVGYFDENMAAGEDTDMVWRINLKGYQLNYVPDAIVYHKRRNKLAELPEAFIQYIYWQYYLIAKYKNIGFSYDYSRAMQSLFNNVLKLFKNAFNVRIQAKQRFIDLFHVFFEICSLITTLYAWLDIKILGRRSFTPFSFVTEKIIWRWNEDGEAMLINLTNGNGYQLDEVSTVVWQFLNEGATIEDILSYIVSEYEVEAVQVKNDIENILNDFRNEGLIKPGII